MKKPLILIEGDNNSIYLTSSIINMDGHHMFFDHSTLASTTIPQSSVKSIILIFAEDVISISDIN